MQQTARTRIYFLDNLKSAVILMVILHHAAMAYMTVPVPSWGLQDVRTCVLFDWMVAWDDAFVMPLMFFVSGYFALGSAVKYSAKEFLRGKWFRIGWPWLTGILFLAPITWHIAHDGFTDWGKLIDWKFRTGFVYSAQYWYLNLLLWFYLLTLLLWKWMPDFLRRRERPLRPGGMFLPLFGLACFLGMFLLNLFIPDGQWCSFVLWECQWVRLPLYLGFFLCGIWAWRNRWFVPEGYIPDSKKWTIAALLCSLGYIGLRVGMHVSGTTIPAPWLVPADNAIRVLLCIVCSFCVISLFQRYADAAGPVWKKLSACAFAVYWIQQPVVDIFARLTLTWDFNCAVKFGMVSLATAVVSFLLAEYLLLKLPFFAPPKPGAKG